MPRNRHNALVLSRWLSSYLAERAKAEGVKCELGAGTILIALRQGANGLSGVELNSRRMLSDDQEPHAGYFKQWCRQNRYPAEEGRVLR